MANPNLRVRILSPQRLLLDIQADAVSSKNLQGKFDILPLHANFITVVEDEPIIIRFKKGKPITFRFPIAIIVTTSNLVNIYTYIQPQS